MAKLIAKEYETFENIKQIDENGKEFWFARDLQRTLFYTEWRNFHKVIDRAMLACKNSGLEVNDHFVEVNKTIEMPKSATKQVIDYKLTRYACYLIVQNGDPRKEVIALGQTYFAIQTRRQELADTFNQLDENNKRLVVRGNIKQWNQLLAEAAHNAGVITDDEFARRFLPRITRTRFFAFLSRKDASNQRFTNAKTQRGRKGPRITRICADF